MTDQEGVVGVDPVRAAPGGGTVLVGTGVVALVGRPVDDPTVDRLWPLVRDGGDAEGLVAAAAALGVADVAAVSRGSSMQLVVRGAVRSEVDRDVPANGSGTHRPDGGVWLRLPPAEAETVAEALTLTLALDRGLASAGAVHVAPCVPAATDLGDGDGEVEVDTIVHPQPPPPPPPSPVDETAPVADRPSADAAADHEGADDRPDPDTVLVPRPPPPPAPDGGGVAVDLTGEVDGDTVVLPPPPAPPPAVEADPVPVEAVPPPPVPVAEAGGPPDPFAPPPGDPFAAPAPPPPPPPPEAGQELWLPEARPTGLAPVITDVPRPATPAPAAADDDATRSLSVYPLGADHDGTTVSAAQLRAIASRSPGAPPATAPAPAGAGHLAVQCPAAHLNPPYADRCRVCGSTIPIQAPFLVPTVDLGVLRFSTGLVKPLVRPLVIGRAPKLGGSFTGPVPELVTVPSPEQDVSRTHVEIRLEGWQVLAVDKGSTNGTTVTIPGHGTQRLRPDLPFPLPVGAVLSLADEVSISFEVTR